MGANLFVHGAKEAAISYFDMQHRGQDVSIVQAQQPCSVTVTGSAAPWSQCLVLVPGSTS